MEKNTHICRTYRTKEVEVRKNITVETHKISEILKNTNILSK